LTERDISIANINTKIKESGALWQAAATSVSKLSAEERKSRLGLIPTNPELKMIKQFGLDKPIASPSKSAPKPKKDNPGTVSVPTSKDWRNVNGVKWTTPIKNQGACGSCVAFGTISALEPLLKIRAYKDSNKTVDLSEAHLLFCGGGSCSGWHMNHACAYLKNNGVPDETCFPYSKGLQTKSCTPCADWKNRIDYTKITSWTNTKDVQKMKSNIANNGPQITGMAVYTDFFSYNSGIYKHVTGDLEGYHCVAVVGYNDTNNYWICKNSWGTGWGEAGGGEAGGWFRIAYGECGIQDVFGMWDMQVPAVKGCGYAKYLLVDYSFTSATRVLWAYAENKWRYKVISDAEVAGIAKLLMESSKVYVCWEENRLTFVRAFK
jgi:C1A family cysteine protease